MKLRPEEPLAIGWPRGDGIRALIFEAPLAVSVDEVAEPRIEAPGDALVRVTASAICGSDLHVYRGAETGLDPGTVLGHEFVGEVLEVGPGVDGLAAGDRVVAPFTTSCGRCFYCHRGLTCRCVHGQLFGWVEGGRGLHGAQAERVRVPLAASTLVKLPRGLDPELALLTGDVLATGFFAAESGGVGPASTVVVLGCGPVGLMAVVAARELGAERVWAVDSVAERRALAAGFGAEALDLGRPGELAAIPEATEGRGADVVLEAVGTPEATRLAVDLVRVGGTISAVGVHTESAFPFSPVEAYDKNLTYRAGRCPARVYSERLLELVASGRHDLGAVVSHRLPLAEAARGYEIFDRKLDGCTKVVLTP